MPESRDAQLNPPDARPRALFHAPAKPERYVNRPEIFNRAKRLLLRDGGDRDNTVALITAFKGGSGFGKTTLAIALCHDPDVRRHFNDRVLFIGLGQQPNLLALLSDQFKLISGEREIFSDLSSAASYFRRLLSGEPILIVLDDVWDKAHAEPFLGVERAKYLITSRDLQVLLALNARGENAIEVNQMTPEEATDLLISGLTPEQRPADLTPFTAYANELGRWALLVQLASGQIASFVEYERMDALEALNEVRRQGFKLLDPQDETERDRAVSASLELSLARLGNWRACFEALAIFPEDVEVPLDAMMHLWRSQGLVQEEEEARRALRAMHRFSLFADYQLNRQRSFARLHGIIRQFLRYKQGNELPALHKKFLDTYRVETWADLPSDEPYLWDHLAYHLAERNGNAAPSLERVAQLRTAAAEHRAQGIEALRKNERERADQHLEAARRAFHEAVALSPQNALLWMDWAHTEKKLQRSEVARCLFRVAIQVDPNYSAAWRSLALLERSLGNIAEARRAFQKAVEVNPRDVIAWQAWAILEKKAGQFDEARRLFAEAVRAAPSDAPSWQAWAVFEKEQGNYGEARRLFAEAVRADPRHAPSWQAWAVFEREQRNYGEARRLFAEAVRADPSNAPSWQAWAVFEREQRNYGEARRLLEEGLQHVYSRRGKGLLHSTLGGLFARRNDLQAAEEHFRKALEYNDQDALTHYYFAVYVLLKTNRREEACVHLRRAEALGVEDEYQRRKIEDAAWYNGCIGA